MHVPANTKYYSAVVGDVNGHLSEVFGKLKGVQKQGFSFVIIAGNLFRDPEAEADEAIDEQVKRLIAGGIEVPLPTYFTLGTRDFPKAVLDKLQESDGELCDNLTLLGRKVSIKTTEGFKIAAIGGALTQGEDKSLGPLEARYTDATVETAAREFGELDILMTSQWPAGIRNGSKSAYQGEAPDGVPSLGTLCAAAKPRYHFSTSDYFFEREPFFQPGPTPRNTTRFISLAPFGTADKRKWIYAFTLQPSAPPPDTAPTNCTNSPFAAKKRKLDSQQDSFNSFRYSNGPDLGETGRGRAKRARQAPQPDECFLCLSNQDGSEHMIASIGDETYVTVAKGPLTTKATFRPLDIPAHMLIIPHAHVATLSGLQDTDKEQLVLAEMTRYRDALQEMVASASKDFDGVSKLGAVTWEINRIGGVHLHWQFLPLFADLIDKRVIEMAFDVEADNLQYPKFVKKPAEIAEAEQGDYLKVMIWSPTTKVQKEIVMPLDGSFRFDLQFARKVLAKLLRLEDRMDWRACAQEKGEEEANKDAFRKKFARFDWTLEE